MRLASGLIVLAGLAPITAAAIDATLLARGEYMFKAAGCYGCHTDVKAKGPALAGGAKLATPFGDFYPPNITPDREHGIGAWSDEDFRRALREGVSPRGYRYYPAFPYTAYTLLHDDDIRAIKAYIFAQPARAQANRKHELVWYARRPLLFFWKTLYFDRGPYVPDPARSAQWNRGAYLANAAVHCGECHTPRTRLGGLNEDRHFAGTRDGPDGALVPNITPDKRTGIGGWSRSELYDYLETGATPDGDYAGDLMAEVIDNSTQPLTRDDRAAIVEYVLSLPPIEHAVRKEKKKTQGQGDFDF